MRSKVKYRCEAMAELFPSIQSVFEVLKWIFIARHLLFRAKDIKIST